MGDLLPLQNCNCSIPDPKPDLLLPVYQFLFVVVYCVPVMMQTARVIDVLHFPVNEPLEERIHPLRTLSTVYASPKKHHTLLFNTITYGSFGHGVMGQLHGLFHFSSRSYRCDTSPVNHPEEYHHPSSQSLHTRNSTCTPFLSPTHRRSTCSVQTMSKEECTLSNHSPPSEPSISLHDIDRIYSHHQSFLNLSILTSKDSP